MRRYKLILILKYYILIIPCCYFKRIFFNNHNIYNFNKLHGFVTDYVGFIKKIMKLMLHKYSTIKKIEVELKQLEEPINLPTRPCKYNIFIFILLKHYTNC